MRSSPISGLLGLVCIAVIAIYGCAAQSGLLELSAPTAAETDYNLLVRGFRAGQLSLAMSAPDGLRQLADPYDPVANAPFRSLAFRLHDLSYYQGRLFLYFGIGPALVLFWPFAALTGHYLWHREAAALFCAVGFLASVAVLRGLWRRYFPEVSGVVVAAGALALGLAAGAPVLLARAEVYEVAISCGQMAVALSLAAVWCALHASERRREAWLVAASAAYGLAIAARPSLLPGSVILLAPVLSGPAGRPSLGKLLRLGAAAAVPLGCCGLGLLLYNARRFGHAGEFGQSFQLAADVRQAAQRHFSPSYLLFNLRVYLLEPVRLSLPFPFIGRVTVPPLPAGHGAVENPFGILLDVPLAWLALAAPLAWRGRSDPGAALLRRFAECVFVLLALGLLTLGLYYYVSSRFESEFLPGLVFLAVIGIFGLERALAGQPTRRRAARWAWGLLLGWSVAFNLCASVEHHAQALCDYGTELLKVDRIPDAIRADEAALRLKPGFAEAHNNLGVAQAQAGRWSEAIAQYGEALRLDPKLPKVNYNWGMALSHAGRLAEAAGQYETALRLEPEDFHVRYDYANTLLLLNRTPDAITQYEAVLRLAPGFAEAHGNLGSALLMLGRRREASAELTEALRLNPNLPNARYNLDQLR